MIRVQASRGPEVPARRAGSTRPDGAAPTRWLIPLPGESGDDPHPEHALLSRVPVQRWPDHDRVWPFGSEYYASTSHRITDVEDAGHRARVRAEMERAIAMGSDVI